METEIKKSNTSIYLLFTNNEEANTNLSNKRRKPRYLPNVGFATLQALEVSGASLMSFIISL